MRPYAKPVTGVVPSIWSTILQQRAQLAVAVGGGADVVQKARRVGQVLGLAVAQREAGKDAGHLEVALQAHPFHRAVELAKVAPQPLALLAPAARPCGPFPSNAR
jgi:hypothetical protein